MELFVNDVLAEVLEAGRAPLLLVAVELTFVIGKVYT